MPGYYNQNFLVSAGGRGGYSKKHLVALNNVALSGSPRILIRNYACKLQISEG